MNAQPRLNGLTFIYELQDGGFEPYFSNIRGSTANHPGTTSLVYFISITYYSLWCTLLIYLLNMATVIGSGLLTPPPSLSWEINY